MRISLRLTFPNAHITWRDQRSLRAFAQVLVAITGLLFEASLGNSLMAAERTFPYRATIDVDAEPVRSGPGPRYDVTTDLPRGTEVVVHRHDPGGWVMIAPPAGSFSWISADDVRIDPQNADRLGQSTPVPAVVTARTALVYVGSELNLSRQVVQRRLTEGDPVSILGEGMLPAENRALRYFRITPPTHEYRWITARALRPEAGNIAGLTTPKPVAAKSVTTTVPDAAELNPFALEIPPESPADGASSEITQVSGTSTTTEPPALTIPQEAIPSAWELPAGTTSPPVTAGTGSQRSTTLGIEPAPLPKLGRSEATPRTPRQKLGQIDQQLREMINKTPDRWDLIQIENQFRQLANETTDEAFRYVINQRIEGLARYTKVHADYIEFEMILQSAREKDAALQAQAAMNQAALQQAARNPTGMNQMAQNQFPQNRGIPGSSGPLPPTSAIQPVNHQVMAPGAPSGNAPPQVDSVPIRAVGRSSSPTSGPPSFDGAGVLKKVQPRPIDFPPLAITTTDGKLLAYVETSDELITQLAEQIGKPVGLNGVRQFDQRYATDVIQAKAWQPVILQNAPLAGGPSR